MNQSTLVHDGDLVRIKVKGPNKNKFIVNFSRRFDYETVSFTRNLKKVEFISNDLSLKNPCLSKRIPENCIKKSINSLIIKRKNGRMQVSVNGHLVLATDGAIIGEVFLTFENTDGVEVIDGSISSRKVQNSILRIGMTQMRDPENVSVGVDLVLKAINQAKEKKADVLMTHECALTGYGFDYLAKVKAAELKKAFRTIKAECKKAGIYLLLGTPTITNGDRYNSLMVIDPDGCEIFRYSKSHLCEPIFKPGNNLALFNIKGIPCTACICHDGRYPDLVRIPVMMGARVFFHPTCHNDSKTCSTRTAFEKFLWYATGTTGVFYVKVNHIGLEGNGGQLGLGRNCVLSPNPEKCIHMMKDANLDGKLHVEVDVVEIDTDQCTRDWPLRSMQRPSFMKKHWKAIVADARKFIKRQQAQLGLPEQRVN